MKVDPETLAALKAAIGGLASGVQDPVAANVVAALAPMARPGTQLKIDIAASETIGAPLVTVSSLPETEVLFRNLTNRQKQVARHLVAGLSNKQIAAELSISVATVKDHVHAVLQRLKLPTRAAVSAAYRGLGTG